MEEEETEVGVGQEELVEEDEAEVESGMCFNPIIWAINPRPRSRPALVWLEKGWKVVSA